VLVTLTGAGHVWPRIRTGHERQRSLLTRILGSETEIIDAFAEMWSFFIAHPLVDSGPVPLTAAAALDAATAVNAAPTPIPSAAAVPSAQS
jgi:hypothetical protein